MKGSIYDRSFSFALVNSKTKWDKMDAAKGGYFNGAKDVLEDVYTLIREYNGDEKLISLIKSKIENGEYEQSE